MLFMGLLEVFLRSQCDLEDPCNRPKVNETNKFHFFFLVSVIKVLIIFYHRLDPFRITNTTSLWLVVGLAVQWLRRDYRRFHTGEFYLSKQVCIPLKAKLIHNYHLKVFRFIKKKKKEAKTSEDKVPKARLDFRKDLFCSWHLCQVIIAVTWTTKIVTLSMNFKIVSVTATSKCFLYPTQILQDILQKPTKYRCPPISSWEFQTLVNSLFAFNLRAKISVKRCNLFPSDSNFISIVVVIVIKIGISCRNAVACNFLCSAHRCHVKLSWKNDRHERKTAHEWYCHV